MDRHLPTIPLGAVGDGIADDTDAIQAALDAAGAHYSRTGLQGRVLLTAGTYVVSSRTQSSCLSIPSGVYLHGPGCLRLASSQPAQTSIVRIEDSIDVTVDGIQLDGNKGNQTTDPRDPKKRAIRVLSSRNVALRNITGIDVDGDLFYFGKRGNSPPAQHCTVEDLWANGIRRSIVTIVQGASFIRILRGYGINWSGDQSSALNIESDGSPSEGCSFENVRIDFPAPESPHTCSAVTITQGHGTLVAGCAFTGNVRIIKSDDVAIINNIIRHPGNPSPTDTTYGEAGIHAIRLCRRLKITGNRISVVGPGVGPIHVACILVSQDSGEAPENVVIRQNVLLPGDHLRGIAVSSLSGTTVIEDNYIDGLGEGGGMFVEVLSNNLPFPRVIIARNTLRNVSGAAWNAGIYFYSGAVRSKLAVGAPLPFFDQINVVENRILGGLTPQPQWPALKFRPSNDFGREQFGDVFVSENDWGDSGANAIEGLGWWRTQGSRHGAMKMIDEFEGDVSPLGAVVGGLGSVYRRRGGGVGTSLYLKTSINGSLGWSGQVNG